MCVYCICSGQTLPKRVLSKTLSPYSSDVIQPYGECSLFWHSIWIVSGKPRHGIVTQIIPQTRTKYNYFVRCAAKNHPDFRRSRMADSVAIGSTRDLWTKFKRIIRSGTSKATEMDGVTEDQDITDLFAAKYDLIHNSYSAFYREISEIHCAINSPIMN